MRYVNVAFVLLSFGYQWSMAQSVRRLIVSGRETSVAAYPFTVALLYCETDWGVRKDCAIFCSGSLIAPNVVLTAGHCVYDSDSPFGYPLSPTPLSNMYVMLGSSDAQSDPAKVIKVKSVINGGYATNLRFPFDDDIGLVLLSECVDLIPDRIETIKLATPNNDAQITSTCTSVTTTGYGRHQNLPKELVASDGKLRVIQDTVHSFETCKAANMDAMGGAFGIPVSILEDMIVPDKHLCAGGDTIWSTCNGDSGGPVVAPGLGFQGTTVQVGITSFGPAGFCGTSPDYSTRVSNYGSWIRDVVSKTSMCPGWTVERMFDGMVSGDPVRVTSRCPAGDWQCPATGECIKLTHVCDGKIHCKDKQDEDTHFCRMMILGRTGPLVGADLFVTETPEPVSPLRDALKREFKSLLPVRNSDDLVAGIFDSPSVNIVGLLETVSQMSTLQSLSALGRGKVDDTATKTCLAPEYTTILTQTIQKDCKDVLGHVDAQMAQHKKAANEDLTDIVSVCSMFGKCVESSNKGVSFEYWLIQLGICIDSNPRKFFSLLGTKESAISLCGTAEYFAERNASRVDYTASFNAKYNSTLCTTISLPEERFSSRLGNDTRSTSKTTIMYSTYVLLITMYQIFWL